METVHIQNSEDSSFSFAFDESSCHSPGFANSLRVEPMHGTVPAQGRYVNCDAITCEKCSFKKIGFCQRSADLSIKSFNRKIEPIKLQV